MAALDVFDLGSLIDPVSKETFFAEHWERRPLHVQRDDPDFFRNVLSLGEIDRVITTLGLHHPQIELTNAKQPIRPADWTFPSGMVDPSRLYQHFADGATIILPQLDHVVPQLAHLCRGMEAEISARFQTNVYLTPGESQGFKTHYDSHDVFVLQVSGEKHWRIYDTPVELPYRGQSFDPNETEAQALTMELVLRPGDVFYLPRGVMHDASTTSGGSLHITLGVLFTSFTDLLVEALARVGLHDPMFRRGLPPGFARDDFDATEARATFAELLRRFVERADFDDVIQHFASDLVSTRHPLIEGQMEQVMRLGELRLESHLGARPRLLYKLWTEGEQVKLSFYGNEMSLPAHAEAPLRHALATPKFRVGDLPGELDDAGKLVLAKRLVREGLVRFVD
jgi:ribosomal protein L16 Arg81 hydroxylase